MRHLLAAGASTASRNKARTKWPCPLAALLSPAQRAGRVPLHSLPQQWWPGGPAASPTARSHTVAQFGNTPLHAAAASGFTETVEALLEAGADASAANDEGDAPAAHMRRRAQSAPEHAPSTEVMHAVEAALGGVAAPRDEL